MSGNAEPHVRENQNSTKYFLVEPTQIVQLADEPKFIQLNSRFRQYFIVLLLEMEQVTKLSVVGCCLFFANLVLICIFHSL